MCVFVFVCVRGCVRVCVRVCVCARVRACVCQPTHRAGPTHLEKAEGGRHTTTDGTAHPRARFNPRPASTPPTPTALAPTALHTALAPTHLDATAANAELTREWRFFPNKLKGHARHTHLHRHETQLQTSTTGRNPLDYLQSFSKKKRGVATSCTHAVPTLLSHTCGQGWLQPIRSDQIGY